MAFQILSAGANVDSIDNEGDTPLLWCLKNNANSELIRLLIRFGSDVCCQDINGNTVMHLFAQQNNNMDMVNVNAAYMAGARSTISSKNKSGQTPYDISWNSKNIVMIRFLWDAWLYERLPASTAPVIIFLSICIVPYLIHTLGLLWGVIAVFFVEVVIFDKLWMPNIFPVLISTNFYICVGLTFSLAVMYFSYVHFHISLASQVIMLSLFAVFLYSWYLCMITPPRKLPVSDRSVIPFMIAS